MQNRSESSKNTGWKSKLKLSNQQKRKIYKMLGAEKFQKVVLFVEDIRYKMIEKFFPNIENWYEKRCDNNYLRTKKKKKKSLYEHQMTKLAFRKEMVYRQNRNYHYNPNCPTKFIQYLKTNKKIHQIGFIKNSIFLILLGASFSILSSTFPVIYSMLVTISLIGVIKDFQCINLQNYNLCRFEDEKMKKRLAKLEEMKQRENYIRLSKVVEPVSTVIENQIELPSIEEVVEKVQTEEAKQQLISYAKWQLERIREAEAVQKQKKIGGI